jgi:hypothetical protein
MFEVADLSFRGRAVHKSGCCGRELWVCRQPPRAYHQFVRSLLFCSADHVLRINRCLDDMRAIIGNSYKTGNFVPQHSRHKARPCGKLAAAALRRSFEKRMKPRRLLKQATEIQIVYVFAKF